MDKYYIGLDIGTNSVGAACTDESYRLLRAKRKNCWAVRLFDEAEPASGRRVFRTMRRRLARRRQRIGFLQEVFEPIMPDPLFFLRLNNSCLVPEDKDDRLAADTNALFADKGFSDKEYHRQYPTIYHLRKALQTEDVKDPRLYYLAIHHIVKYRGHFLFDGGVSEFRDPIRLLTALGQVCEDVYGEDAPSFDVRHAEELKRILVTVRGVNDKKRALTSLFVPGSDAAKEIITALAGGKLTPKKLFSEAYADEQSFAVMEKTDEEFEALRETYGEDFALLEAIRAICNFALFEKLLQSSEDLSSAMIAVYDRHKRELKELKAFVKANGTQEDYRRLFKATDQYDSNKRTGNYANYVGYTKKGGDKVNVPHVSYEGFLLWLKAFLTALPAADEEQKASILARIEAREFLPQILHSDNGVIPHQLNEAELKKILENMVRNLPQTAEIAQKTPAIFLFRVPYYVGPLTGKNAWVVRNFSQKVTPWNFKDVVDEAASNENFMRRMTNKCTYLHGEDVLPRQSITYQKYDVLNQLNKLRVNGDLLPVEVKQGIYRDLFLQKSKVTDKAIRDYLVRTGQLSSEEAARAELGGKDGEIKANMSSYIKLKKTLGDFVDRDLAEGGGVCEDIILWHTLNTDKGIVASLIKKKYGHRPEVMQKLSALKGLTFKEFGRLSARFLTDLRTIDPSTGELLSVLDLLYDTQENLNEILFDERYGFSDLLRRDNGEESGEITKEDVDELYVSPAVKRGILQSLRMVDEYVGAIGRAPDKIFVEVTRGADEKAKGRTTSSRKKTLTEIYRAQGLTEFLTEISDPKYTDMRLRQERLYLWFRQLGRCMYSGERIELSDLNGDTYDVDHILPRSYVKDDSIENKVLVLRAKNQEKRDLYPLPAELVTPEARRHWDLLLRKGLLSGVTYERLTRTEPLGENDYRDFINRQKTITDQTAKAVAELLGRKYPDTKIVYSRARNVSDFRQQFSLAKSREANDLHHARDAYLNVVVGNVYDVRFSSEFYTYYKKEDEWREYNLKKLFTKDIKGAWSKDSIDIVKKVMADPSPCVTRYAFEFGGNFYDQTVYPASDTAVTAPRKKNLPAEKYGGYKSQKTAYFAIVRSKGRRGAPLVTVEPIPVLVAYRAKVDPDAVKRYLSERLTEPELVVPKVKVKQLITYNGTALWLAGVQNGNRIIYHNAIQLFLDRDREKYVSSLEKLSRMRKERVVTDETLEEYVLHQNREGVVKAKVDREQNQDLYDYLTEKLGVNAYGGVQLFETLRSRLIEWRRAFFVLSVAKQADVLLNLLKAFKCNAEKANLKEIGGSASEGNLILGNNITDVDFRLIYLSPCGLTVKERRI